MAETFTNLDKFQAAPLEMKRLVIEHYILSLVHNSYVLDSNDHSPAVRTKKSLFTTPMRSLYQVSYAFGQDVCLPALQAVELTLKREVTRMAAEEVHDEAWIARHRSHRRSILNVEVARLRLEPMRVSEILR